VRGRAGDDDVETGQREQILMTSELLRRHAALVGQV
jgi:hypothetical protein